MILSLILTGTLLIDAGLRYGLVGGDENKSLQLRGIPVYVVRGTGITVVEIELAAAAAAWGGLYVGWVLC